MPKTLDMLKHSKIIFSVNKTVEQDKSIFRPLKQPINIEKCKILTPKSGIQELVVIQKDCSPQNITSKQYYMLKKFGECKNKPADFQFLDCPIGNVFSRKNNSDTYICPICETQRQREFFHEILPEKGYSFYH